MISFAHKNTTFSECCLHVEQPKLHQWVSHPNPRQEILSLRTTLSPYANTGVLVSLFKNVLSYYFHFFLLKTQGDRK